jgi:hypothetical protein
LGETYESSLGARLGAPGYDAGVMWTDDGARLRRRWTTVALVAALAAAGLGEDPRREPKVELKLGASPSQLAVSPDGRWIGANADSFVALFSTEKRGRQVVADFGGLAEPPLVTGLVFTQDSRFLVFLTLQRAKPTLRVVDAATAREVRTIAAWADIEASASPGGSKVLVRFGIDADPTVVDVATGERTPGPRLRDGVVMASRAGAAGPTAEQTLQGRPEFGSLSVLDDGAAAPRWTIDLAQAAAGAKGSKWARASPLAWLRGFTSDAKYFVVVLTWEEVDGKLWRRFARLAALEAATGKTAWTRDETSGFSPVGAIPADGVVAVIGENGKLDFLDEATGERRWSAPAGEKYVSLATSPDGRTFWAGTKNGNIVKLSAPAAAAGK